MDLGGVFMTRSQFKVNIKPQRRGIGRPQRVRGFSTNYRQGTTPWGKPALGYPTSRRGNRTIVRRPQNGIIELSRDNITCFIGTTSGNITFGEKLKDHMLRLRITNEWLAEETGLTPKAIQRLRNPTTTHPELSQVVAVCLAMQLLYTDSSDLVETAGYNLRRKFELEALYDYFLSHIDEIVKINESSIVAFCNKKLIELGHKPLTKLT